MIRRYCCTLLLLHLCLLPLRAQAANTFGALGNPLDEMQQYLGTIAGPMVYSGCAPSVPGSGLALNAFACTALVRDASTPPRLVPVIQSAVTLTVPNSATVWLALHHDLTSTPSGCDVGNWTRRAGSHYLTCANVSQPATPPGAIIFAKVSVTDGNITAIRVLSHPTATGERTINAVRDCEVVATSDVFTATAWADQTAPLQACLNSAVVYTTTTAGTRATVYLPTGQYYLASRVTIPTGVCLVGDGKLKTIVFSDTSFNDSNGLLDFDGGGNTPTCLQGMNVSVFGGAGLSSVGINADINGAFVSDVWVVGFNIGIRLAHSDVFLTDFFAELHHNAGVFIQSNHVTVSHGSTWGNPQGVVVDNSGWFAHDAGEVIITNVRDTVSKVNGFALTGHNITLGDISCWANEPATFYSNACVALGNVSSVRIANVHALIATDQHPAAKGIVLDSTTSRVTISNCELRGWRNGLESNGATEVLVSNCLARDNGVRGFSITNGDRVTLVGNQAFSNGTVGSVLDSGFFIQNSLNFATMTLVGNLAIQQGGGPQDYGFTLLTQGNASTRTTMLGNVAQFNAVANVFEAGTTTENQGIAHFGNETPLYRVLTATAALDFGNTAAQDTATLTISVPGAVHANIDSCSLGVENGSVPADGHYFCWVSADDTVSVRFINNTRRAIDPTPGTFRVFVFKATR